LCEIQASCSGCLAVDGCVWNFGACLSASAVSLCGNANCINVAGLCPVLTIPSVYAGASLPISASIGTPWFDGSIYARPSVTASVYPSPLYTPPLYTPPLLPPAATPIYSTSSIYSSPLVSADSFVNTAPSFASPVYVPPVSASFAAPVYASGSVYAPPVSAGVYGGVGVYGGGNFYDNNGNNNNGLFGGGLLDQNGGFLQTNIRNNFLGSALEPVLPGIGGVLSTANDLNVITNAPKFIDSTINGNGYRRDPVGSYVRNSIFSNELGDLVPGLSGSLDAFNKVNLYASLLGGR